MCSSPDPGAFACAFPAPSTVAVETWEVGGAADVVVRDRRPVRGPCRPSAIEVVFEDRVDRAVGARTDIERAATHDRQLYYDLLTDQLLHGRAVGGFIQCSKFLQCQR
jgi:hypothetical protein